MFVLFPVLYIRIRIRIHYPDPDPGGAKMTHKIGKKLINRIFYSAGCSHLRTFAVVWTSLLRPRDKKMTIFDQKDRKKFSAVFFS